MLYRGIIADTDDSEKRRRYRVRVFGVHRDDTPAMDLRWAELMVPFSTKLAGDVPNYNIGDHVFVMFEDETKSYPVIVGGWLTTSSGLDDLPTENADDYSKGQKRWLRIDRNGNKLELSTVSDEDWVKIQSGSAMVTASQVDNSVRLTAKSGAVVTQAAQAQVIADSMYGEHKSFFITVADFDALGGPAGFARLVSNFDVSIHGGTTVAGVGYGGVNIGGYVPTFMGASLGLVFPASAFFQSPAVNVLSRFISIGTGPGEFSEILPAVPLPETAEIDVKAQVISLLAQLAVLNPHAGPVKVEIDAVNGTVTIGSLLTLAVAMHSGVSVTISAPIVSIESTAGNTSVTASAGATITAPTVDIVSPQITMRPV